MRTPTAEIMAFAITMMGCMVILIAMWKSGLFSDNEEKKDR